ncbi:DUF3137 domain-containing protein [Mesorhizobium sp. AR10]|uniref:hypothetical protein n=1 Tax=Mesorhizobium sp. AR10 TaxID=2865839 RepID=UPI00215EC13E|nr:hypothetical protein [Mesorhizobium sp. AR10]UVK37138.1 DUF3137 domain-containing protein [Mesorhizobium sp. AR10]
MSTKDLMPSEAVIAAIQKDFELYESERLRAAGKVRWQLPLFFGLLIVVAVLLTLLFNELAAEQWFSQPHIVLYCATMAGAFLAYKLGMKPATDLQQSFRAHLLPVILGFVTDVTYRHGVRPISFARLPTEATGSFDREYFDDVISGTYEGFPFELYETHLTQKRTDTETLFKGVILAFQQARPFPGLLVATRRAGPVSQFFRDVFGGKLLEIQSGMPVLDGRYEFRTDHVDAARPLVSGDLARALQLLGETWRDEPVRVALHGDDGFLLLPSSKNFFELPDISAPLDHGKYIEKTVAEMAALLATAALVRKAGTAESSDTDAGVKSAE